MNRQHIGSCLCGNVRFSIEGTFERFYLCHCGHCRKDSGSAHTANLFSTTATLTWLSGQSSITRFQLAGSRHARSFCCQCGSALPLASDGLLVVPAGSLDTPLDLTPDGNLFTASRADWDHDLHTAPPYDAFPT